MSAMARRMSDDHGDRMKSYETDERLNVLLPIYARIDGRSFSKFTRGMDRPFDIGMSEAMSATARGLVERTHARIGYTQSDEISLIFMADNENSDVFFAGRTQKLASVLASLATALFTARMHSDPRLEQYRHKLPHFDCRVCQLPSKTEAANMLVWRYKDACKNSIIMAASAVFSHKQLHKKNGADMYEMLLERGVDFNQYPNHLRRGEFLQRRSVMRELSPDELAQIPEKHRPNGPVQRHEIARVECDDFLKCANREAMIFDAEKPIYSS